MPALLALIPLKDWLYAGLIAFLIIFGVVQYHDIEAKGAAHEAATVQALSVKTDAAAKEKNDKLTADYSAAVVTVGVTYAKAMQTADAAHAADVQRLQHFAAANHGASPGVGGTAGSGAAADAGTGSALALGVVPAERAVDLADALRADDAALTQCYADRDALTGK